MTVFCIDAQGTDYRYRRDGCSISQPAFLSPPDRHARLAEAGWHAGLHLLGKEFGLSRPRPSHAQNAGTWHPRAKCLASTEAVPAQRQGQAEKAPNAPAPITMARWDGADTPACWTCPLREPHFPSSRQNISGIVHPHECGPGMNTRLTDVRSDESFTLADSVQSVTKVFLPKPSMTPHRERGSRPRRN